MRHAHAHIPLGENHLIHADLREHLGVQLIAGPGHQIGHAHILAQKRHKDGGLDIIADGDHHHVEIPQPQGLKGLLVSRIGLNGLRHLIPYIIHQLRAAVNGQHFLIHVIQRPGHGAPKGAQADYGKLFHPRFSFPGVIPR